MSPATILLVDDTPANLVALRAVLEPLGHRLLDASSGAEALRVLLTPGIEDEVALILLDVQMPDMDGFETATRIKERERTEEIPIIFLTAHSTDTLAAMRGFETGAVDYLTRPLDAWLLRSKVQVFVELYEKNRVLAGQRQMLASRLGEQLEAEARMLQRLADAAIAINSTRSLGEMLDVINTSAREVLRARDAETFVTVAPGAVRARTADLSAISSFVRSTYEGPVRMTKQEVEQALAGQGLEAIEPGNPVRMGWLAVPLIGRTGRPLGRIQVADKAVGDFTDSDELVLVQLAHLAAVAVENAERYEHERRIAETLQRSLLPDEPLHVAGVDLAAHYQPGSAGTEAGGDWYDAFELFELCETECRALAFTVGDVMGRGPRAAAVMGQLRTAIRAYAIHGVPPVPLFERLDQLLDGRGGFAMATAVYGVVDLASRQLELVNAGHPPPLLVPPRGRPRYLDLDPGVPLGVDGAPAFKSSTFDLDPGTVLVLYTDGLVESRELPIDEGLAALLDAATNPPPDLHELCSTIVNALVPEGTGDDIALLTVRVH